MLNPKTHHPFGPCQQRDIDICAALMGQPVGKTTVEDLQTELPLPPATHLDLTNLFMLPTNKVAMKAWVKQVQSRVVHVSETMKSRMSEVGDQVKERMADSAVQAARRLR